MQQLRTLTRPSGAALECDAGSSRRAYVKLEPRLVEKPWGRVRLPALFSVTSEKPIGEVWFVDGEDLPLLPKYLFTSETLSVQVHPNDEQARARGLVRGKTECWYILEAEPGAVIGLGLRTTVAPEELRAAALDGSIEQLIDWRPARAGDFFFVPPGTIHAIGGGISLLELQQNSDTTYRLYDYGRPRELHLDDGLAVANCSPYPAHLYQHVDTAADAVLVDCAQFTLVHSRSDVLLDRRRWILPIEGYAAIGGEIACAGECLLVEPHQRLDRAEGRLLIGAAPQTANAEVGRPAIVLAA